MKTIKTVSVKKISNGFLVTVGTSPDYSEPYDDYIDHSSAYSTEEIFAHTAAAVGEIVTTALLAE